MTGAAPGAQQSLRRQLVGRAERSSPMSDPRSVLQERVALYARVQFALSAGGLVIRLVIAAAQYLAAPRPWTHPETASFVGHFATAILYAAGWLYCRRGVRSASALHALEGGGTVFLCLGFAGVTLVAPATGFGAVPARETMVALVILLIATRAALVPSSALRTTIVGLLSIGPITLTTLFLELGSSGSRDVGAAARAFSGVGVAGLSFVVVSAVTSRVIYGLQARVREAVELGKYSLEEKIGEGGMGAVYRGRHALLRRPIAIKLLRPGTSSEGALARFEQEVQHTSQLTHPNTVQIYDYGHTSDGVFYYVMEYLDGLDLERLVALDGAQPAGRVIHVLSQVCDALAEAHGAGLVHRDIKPSNILLADRGGIPDLAKIADFGLVKELQSTSDVALTGAGVIVGTPAFMAPELATPSTGNVDGRSDLYSLGAVGYFLLTGRHVFEGVTALEVIAKHLTEEPAPPSAPSGVPIPEDLSAVILRCLRKRPVERFADARALSDALRACADAAAWARQDASAWWEKNRERVVGQRDGSGERSPERGEIAFLPTLAHGDSAI